MEGTKEALAAHAWFTAGHLTAQLASTYCQLGHGKMKKAIAAYDNAIRLDPTHAEAYLHRGKVKNTLEHYEAALADLNEALRLKPATKSVQAAVYTARGVAKFGLGEPEAAFADHAEALRLNPNCAEAWLEELDVPEGDNRWLAAPGRTGSISNSHSNTASHCLSISNQEKTT